MKGKIVSLLIWTFIGSSISSCMETRRILGLSTQNREEASAKEMSSEIAILLSYNKHISGLTKERLEAEKAKAEQAVTDFNAPIHRLRLAMVLSLSNPGSEDYLSARALLRGDLPEDAKPDPVLRDFAVFLEASLLRLEEQETRHQALIQKLKGQAERDQEMSQKIKNQENQNQKLLQKLKEEEEQSQKLQKMIEELKTIEKNIMNDKNIMKRENGNPSQ